MKYSKDFECNLDINEIKVSHWDTDGELVGGHRLDISFKVHNDDFEDIPVGNMELLIFDDKDGNLLLQADAHSQYIYGFMEDVNVIGQQDDYKRFDTLALINLTYGESIKYNKECKKYPGVNVCGRVALLSKFAILEGVEDTPNLRKSIYRMVNKKLFRLFNVDFIMAQADLTVPPTFSYQPDTVQDFEENEAAIAIYKEITMADLMDIGFKETGIKTLITKNEGDY